MKIKPEYFRMAYRCSVDFQIRLVTILAFIRSLQKYAYCERWTATSFHDNTVDLLISLFIFRNLV